MYDTRLQLQAEAEKILQQNFGDSTVVHFDVSLDDKHGDLTTSVALQLAKKVQKKPHDIAALLAEGLQNLEGVEKTEVAGAGFVNIFLTPAALLSGMTQARSSLSPKKIVEGSKPIVFDYSHPNIAKPLGVHHLLTTIIGQSLVNLYKHLGHETVSVNHIGDWGTQFGKLAVAYERWGTKPIEDHSIDDLLALYVQFHSESEKVSTLEDEGRAAFKRLEDGDTKLRAFWETVTKITMKSMEHMYERLHVEFDFTLGESFYEDKMAPILEEGKKKKVFVEGKEGALVVEFPEESGLQTAIVLKGDGSSIYLTRDLATIRYRIDIWHPEAILYVVDVAQQLYFQQLFATVQQLGWTLPTLEHVHFGRMRFSDKSMSTRKGNILRLEQVLDEAVKRADAVIKERGEKIQTDDPKALSEMIGIGAVIYGILSQNRKMDMVFDWDKMLTFEGNSAPYVQYTHARAKSVLRKAGEAGELSAVEALTTRERTLLKILLTFAETLEEARSEHLPHKLTNYLYELCQAFNSFYSTDEILTSTGATRECRLVLTALTADVLKCGAELLTLRVPDRM